MECLPAVVCGFCFENEIIVFMNETNAISNDGVKRMPTAGQPHLPHIVTVGRYRVGRVLERLAQLWSGEARFSHISASFDDAVAQVQALNLRQPIDALVGAGASGAWIRERVDIPMAMVEVRGLDLLQALRQAKLQATEEAPRVGLVNFEVPSPVVAQFDSLFGLGLVQIAYQGPHDAQACVQKLRESGVGAVVAPGLVADLAEQAGMASVLLYSDISVRQALSDAMLLARHRRAERDRHQRLETVLHQLQDGVAAVDERGRICALNPRMAALLGARSRPCTAACWTRWLRPWARPGHWRVRRGRGGATGPAYPGGATCAHCGERAGERCFAGLPRSRRDPAGRSQPARQSAAKSCRCALAH